MSRILLVDDEPSITAFTRDRLSKEGFRVAIAATGQRALSLVAAEQPDLVVLDVMLPDMDGFEVLRRLRQGGHTLPVIMLTAKSDDVDRIVGLELGADDYVVKPFNPRELVARVRAVLRRQAEAQRLAERVSQLEAQLEPSFPETGLHLDPTRRQARFDGQLLDLRPREYDLLHFLAQHPGQVFTRQTLLNRVWGEESYIDERTVDVHVRRLRQKITAIAPQAQVILTEWGVGYKLAKANGN